MTPTKTIQFSILCIGIIPLFCGCYSSPTNTPPSLYGLNNDTIVVEAGSMNESANPDWWINSGAYMFVEKHIGRTIQGSLPSDDRWRLLYARNNPVDTDNGFRPQNIFRLLARKRYTNVNQMAYFKMNACNANGSPQRAGDNGILFFSRYENGNNVYYGGIRVDGKAVIKKKLNGKYTTLASTSIFPGAYNRTARPNLIPLNEWIGIYMSATNMPDGRAHITLAIDKGIKTDTETFKLAVEAIDDGQGPSGQVIASGHAGIRSDFMDMEFRSYMVHESGLP